MLLCGKIYQMAFILNVYTSAQLKESAAESEKLLKQLIATGDEYQALLDEAERKESETASKIDELEYAYDEAKDREYQQWLASQKPTNNGGSSNVVDGVTWLLPITPLRSKKQDPTRSIPPAIRI